MRGLIVCAFLLSLAAPARAAPEVSPGGMRGLNGAQRAIIISASGTRTTHATARTYARDADGAWRLARKGMPARLGASGLSRGNARHEGDGTTPMGAYGFVYGFGSQPDPGMTGFAWRRLNPSSCWAADRAHYNRWVARRPCGTGENLWSSARVAYRYAAVIDFNYASPVVGRGSGIFLHAQTGRPTRGCVALRERDLLAVLRWLRAGSRIVIGTTSYLRSLKPG